MFKKISAIILAVLMIALCFAGCGAKPEEPTPTEEPEIKGSGKLIVGFDAEFPPFGFIAADGSYDGFDLACAKEVCKRLNWEYGEVAVDWDAKDNELEAGNITCIWNGFTCTGRENEYTWTTPYYDNSIVAVVKADSGIKTIEDLAGKTAMVQKASSASDAINGKDCAELKASLKEVIELPDYNTGFMELNQGTVDAVFSDIGVAKYQIGDAADAYVIIEEPVSIEQYGVGFYLGNTVDRDLVEGALKEMAEDGTMLELANKYAAYGLEVGNLTYIR